MLDILIKNGNVITGLDKDVQKVDLGIVDGRIAEISPAIETDAKKTIEATGLIVSPGFIDLHAHDDLDIIVNPQAKAKVLQGITTQVNGNCGIGPAPLVADDELWRNLLYTILGHDVVNFQWHGFSEYLQYLQGQSFALNNLVLISHGAIRAAVVGMEDLLPSDEAMQEMSAMVEEAMQAGAAGFSTGLIYVPAAYSSEEELLALTKTCAKYDGLFVPHGRSTGENIIESISELVRISEESEIHLHIPHNKITGRSNWSKQDQVFDILDQTINKGLEVTWDIHTYNGASTTLLAMLPPTILSKGFSTFKNLLENTESRKMIKEMILQKSTTTVKGWDLPEDLVSDWSKVLVASVHGSQNKKYEGKSFAEIMNLYNIEPYDLALSLLYEENGMVGISVQGAYSDEQVATLIKSSRCAIATDGIPGEHPDPRMFGTFPRFISRFVKDMKAINMVEAIDRMCVLPAKILKLNKRGSLQKGNFADITIFNYDLLEATSTFENPVQYPEGIEYVLVNGTVVVEKSKHTGSLPGKILKYAKEDF